MHICFSFIFCVYTYIEIFSFSHQCFFSLRFSLFTDILSNLEWIVDTAIGIFMKNPALFTTGIPHQQTFIRQHIFLLLLMLYLFYDLNKDFKSVLIIWHLSNA